MKIFSSCITKVIVACAVLFCGNALAQTVISPPAARVQTYSVQPDYRRCASPICGGWFLTPVNLATLHFQTEEEALAPPPSFAPIYVAAVDYRSLGLTPEEIARLEMQMRQGLALLRGALKPYIWPANSPSTRPLNILAANGAWTAANNNRPIGSYLNVKSSGIVCITTPCPYYEAELINTSITSLFDELNFRRAELTAAQELKARRAVAEGGLVLTGFIYPFKGVAGEGKGIAATQVYFSYPK